MALRIPSSLAQPQPAPPGWVRRALPAPLGDCHAEAFSLGDGIVLSRAHYCPVQDLVEESEHVDEQAGALPGTLVITLALAGQSAFTASDGTALRFRAGHTTLAAVRRSRGDRHFAAGQPVRQLRLLISGAALQRYVGPDLARRLLQGEGVRPLDHRPTPPASLALARRLWQPPAAHATDTLDRHIAMLSLAALELRHIAPSAAGTAPSAPSPGTALRWSDRDVARLERARDLLHAQMERPLTLAYLGAAVGMHPHKLTHGFRALFGATPQHLLLDMRMRRAWALLEAGCPVAQVAGRVGYAHAPNFSAAFARFFGHPPKSVFGKRA